MSFRLDGLNATIGASIVSIPVETTHRLVQLANALDWNGLVARALPDLKKTARGMWWRGRPLFLRVHMGVYLLQSLYNETDRGIEDRIKYDASFQTFCGGSIVPDWGCPDHTKIESFRNRLTAETQRQLIDIVLLAAMKLGFADPTWMDVDSTVQEANISYPSDANLMTKLAQKCKKVLDYLKGKAGTVIPGNLEIEMSLIRKKAQEYFFLAKNKPREMKRLVFRDLHQLIKQQVFPFLKVVADLNPDHLKSLPWNISRELTQVSRYGKRYILDVAHFIRKQTIKAGKILSLHAQALSCIKKGKLGKDFEFGRVYQLGRIGGNFLITMACDSIRMEDKQCLGGMIGEHARLFGEGVLKSIGTDKGYYSSRNLRSAFSADICEVGIQCPGSVKAKGRIDEAAVKTLRDRRAGIEPLIGHAKKMGLGRSRMKSDTATLASGYRCVLGFNLRQLANHQIKDLVKAA